jgi:phosphoribosylamine--glycine ligase
MAIFSNPQATPGVLVLGSGGREHAMCRALQSGAPTRLVCAPGNPGTAVHATSVDLPIDQPEAIVALCRREGIELIVPGPEAALTAGVADAALAAGIACCGPTAAAARLESSKSFTRTLGQRLQLPQPRHWVVRTTQQLHAATQYWRGLPPVVKADGLAAGKGVFLPDSVEQAVVQAEKLLGGFLGEAGKTVVIEERLVGDEASMFFACSGMAAVAMPHARDHKRLGAGDRGPNTGGMGAVSPNTLCDAALTDAVHSTFVLPVLREMQRLGTPFCGFLFVGVMLTARGPQLLEFNVRLGDPEAQAILPRLLPGEFLRLCRATAAGKLEDFSLQVSQLCTCAVVLAAAGYPQTPRLGDPIALEPTLSTYPAKDPSSAWFVHAGTRYQDQVLQTAGGRVAAVVACGETQSQARKRAYAGVAQVSFAGMQVRLDIGEALL